jgi:cation diffusion facilitator CzcD-associated flavoprotein CzcO
MLPHGETGANSGSYDFKNKKVGVIGGGSSSIQIVPNLQKVEGVKLTCFVRSRTWISNPFGDSAMEKLGLDPKSLDCKFKIFYTIVPC